MRFLELTTIANVTCLVNIANICDIHPHRDNGGCTIYFSGEQNQTSVLESLEEIKRLLELAAL